MKYILVVLLMTLQLSGFPKISIITSVYNANMFIAQFLADITRQTIFQEQCELIIINANKWGRGVEECAIKRYMERFPKNIRYKRLLEDPGLYGVWNMGIKMARGEYITNANVDDRLAPDCYEVHAQILDKYPDVALVYSNSYITRVPNETFEEHSTAGVVNHSEFYPGAIKQKCIPSFNPMWRKSVHGQYGYFDMSFTIAADWEMWVRMIVKGAKFKKAPGFHGLFYYNPSGLSLNRAGYDKQMKERERVREKYKEFFSE